ncbi:hypothetical protein NS226_18980 [Aureimonas ureilytica]|uniref:HTH gntR-type domain-containing protein n=1 Tax=Aureimonas ureilytica TaxID=401562 RepID=A0A175R3M6_9HYPH|nr:hypothetical protein NS226_18980 [Aureimonas ureilytica]
MASPSENLSVFLRDRILTGALRAGEKLPTEAQLAESFQLSRPSVREAIAVLRAEDLVVSRRGSGSFVSATPRFEIRLTLPTASLEDVTRMIELRRAIETEATRLAAARRTSAQLEALREAERALLLAEAEGRDGVCEDLLFHRIIAEATGNDYLLDVHLACQQVLTQAMRATRANERRRASFVAEVHAEHARILLAIEAGEGAWAADAMATHLLGAERRLRAARAETADG